MALPRRYRLHRCPVDTVTDMLDGRSTHCAGVVLERACGPPSGARLNCKRHASPVDASGADWRPRRDRISEVDVANSNAFAAPLHIVDRCI